MTVSTNNGLVNGPAHNPLVQFFTLGSSKIEVSKTYFFDIVITYNDHPRYVKHVLGCIYVFFALFGYWARGCGGCGGVPRDWYTLLIQFFTLDSSKIKVSETYFFDIVTTQYDHPRYVKHVLGRIYVFFTLFGYWVRGGGFPRDWYTTCLYSFSPRTAQKLKFPKLIFLIP